MTIYLDRFSDIVKRLIATVGGEALQGLNPELSMAVILENDRPEFAALGSTRLWCAYTGLLAAGGAGHFNQFLTATGDAKVLHVVTHVLLTNPCNVAHIAQVGMVQVANGVAYRDNRLGGKPATKLFTKDSASASMSGAVGKFNVPANVVTAIPPFVAVAGGALWETQTNNVSLEAWIAGYERYTTEHETDATVT